MFQKLVIKNFRGIAAGQLEDFGKINLLIGPNNSGKTAILEMLYLAAVNGRPCSLFSNNLQVESPLPPAEEPESDEPSPDEPLLDLSNRANAPTTPSKPTLHDQSKTKADSVSPKVIQTLPGAVPLPNDFLGYRPWPRLWQRHGQETIWRENNGALTDSNSLSYRITNLAEQHPFYDFKLIPPLTNRLNSYGGFSVEDVATIASCAILPAPNLPPELLPHTANQFNQLVYSWYPKFIHQGQPLALWGLQGERPNPNKVLFFDFHTVSQHFNPSFWEMAWNQVPDWYELIAENLGEIFPELKGCRVEIVPVNGGYAGSVRRPGERPILIDHFGDGARHAFKLLAALIALKTITPQEPALLLWEDPELFMHPAGLKTMLTIIAKLIADLPIQLFISTHDNELIAILTHLTQQLGLADSLRAFRLGRQNGRLVSAGFRTENLRSWLESGKDPRFWGVAKTVLHYQMEAINE